jgi:NAD(P)-dependent dehydrogenase (short-subunit alcohol dehydrogenase family)
MSPSKTILITGASIGIGHSTAELFQSRGWNVVATMRNPTAAMARDTSIQDLAARENVLVTPLDVTNQASIDTAISAAISRFGSIDVLVNNAGYGLYGILEATSIDDLRQQFETNVIGLLATTKALIPHFRKQHSGIIINISSIGGLFSIPASAPYGGTKFAVEGISEALTHEMRSIGVRVKLIEPGFIKTNFGNAMTFANDPAIPDYQPLVASLFKTFASMAADAADPSLVAEVIYRAATDGTDQLRYLAGADAEQIQAARKSLDDAEFLPAIATRFGQ